MFAFICVVVFASVFSLLIADLITFIIEIWKE
jgi:hypothetical protein